MAEFVEKRLEEMIPEMEELERTALLSPEEVRQLVVRRRHLLYKMEARHPSKADFVNAIQYEATLLDLLAIRRKKLRITEKYQQIEQVIMKRQEQLLRVASRKFVGSFDIWEMRINFAKNIRHVHEVRVAYREMTLKHSRLVSLWLNWANYEMRDRKDFQKAREILLSEAPMHHPKSKDLKRELFRFDLLHQEHLFQGRLAKDMTNEGSVKMLSEANKQVFMSATSRLLYTKITEEHSDMDMSFCLYHIAYHFPFAVVLREMIYSDILERFSKAPEVVILKAERSALGLPTEESLKEESDKEDEEQTEDYLKPYNIFVKTHKELKNRVEVLPATGEDRKQILSTYLSTLTEGIAQLASDCDDDVMISMLSLYCSEMIGLLYHCWSCKPSTMALAQHFTDTCTSYSHLLNPLNLMVWAAVLDEFPSVSSPWSSYAVLQEAGTLHSAHEPTLVWALFEAQGNKAIIEEYTKIEGKLSPAWKKVANVFVTTKLTKGEERSQFLEGQCSALRTDKEAVVNARVARMWSQYQDKDLDAARQVYNHYSLMPPFYEQLHSTMCTLELYGSKEQQTELAAAANLATFGEGTSSIIAPQFCLDTKGDRSDEGEAMEGGNNESDNDESVTSGYGEESEQEAGSDDEGNVSDNEESASNSEENNDSDDEENNESDNEKDSEKIEDSNNEEESDNNEEESDNNEEESDNNDEEDSDNEDQEVSDSGDDDEDKKLKFELCRRPDVDSIRNVFKKALQQSRGKHHDVWLAFVEFELRFGSAMEAGRMIKRAEADMTAYSVQAFREMTMDIKQQRFQSVDEAEQQKQDSQNKESSSAGPDAPMLLSSLTKQYFKLPTKTKLSARTNFFATINKIDAHVNKSPSCPEGLGVSWHDVLTLLLDGNCVKPVLLETVNGVERLVEEKTIKQQLSDYKDSKTSKVFVPGHLMYRNSYKTFKGSDELQVCVKDEERKKHLMVRRGFRERDDIDAKIAKSEVLKPEFLKKTEVGARMTFRHRQRIAKAERQKNAGKKWDYLPATEMTPELERDIELLKMRSILDPKQRFKTTHMKRTTKFFQIGTMKDDPSDYYSGRLTKKQRKSTFAEQIMNDQDVVSFQKRKYSQLVSEREANRRQKKKRKTGVEFISV